MAKAKTTVVVKKSPTAAVAVNSERFITISTFKNLNNLLGLKLY